MVRKVAFVFVTLIACVALYLLGWFVAWPWSFILHNSTTNSIYTISWVDVRSYGLYPVQDEVVIPVHSGSVALALPTNIFSGKSSWVVDCVEDVRVSVSGFVSPDYKEGYEGNTDYYQILKLDIGDYRGAVTLRYLDEKRGELCLNVELV